MKICMITFRSVMPAQRAEKILQREGIAGRITRTPKWMEQQGCGYSLRIRCEDIAAAAQHLRQNQIPFRKGYLLRESGTVEEIEL